MALKASETQTTRPARRLIGKMECRRSLWYPGYREGGNVNWAERLHS